MMDIVLYSEKITPRLRYIVDFLFAQNVRYIHDWKDANQNECIVAYSLEKPKNIECYWIAPQGLLGSENIAPQNIQAQKGENYSYFFQNGSDFGFDIFSAAFYLLSRYEEYLPFKKDEYGRYDVKNSLAFQHHHLDIPLIDLWKKELFQRLKVLFSSLQLPKIQAKYIPTFDIDIAYSYKYKSLWRSFGGLGKDLFKGKFEDVKDRINTLWGSKKDPFDTYELLEKRLSEKGLQPTYFFPIARKIEGYDKNISPFSKGLQNLIQEKARTFSIGMHPSWRSRDDSNELIWEKDFLEKLSQKKIEKSRQHYIRMLIPEKYPQLISLGIREEYSMGYGSINGFRASTAHSFYWFDLLKNEQTNLLIFPFCFMDANSYYEQKFTADQMKEEMKHYWNTIQIYGGNFISIMHNNFLSEQSAFSSYRNAILDFWEEMSIREIDNSKKD